MRNKSQQCQVYLIGIVSISEGQVENKRKVVQGIWNTSKGIKYLQIPF